MDLTLNNNNKNSMAPKINPQQIQTKVIDFVSELARMFNEFAGKVGEYKADSKDVELRCSNMESFTLAGYLGHYRRVKNDIQMVAKLEGSLHEVCRKYYLAVINLLVQAYATEMYRVKFKMLNASKEMKLEAKYDILKRKREIMDLDTKVKQQLRKGFKPLSGGRGNGQYGQQQPLPSTNPFVSPPTNPFVSPPTNPFVSPSPTAPPSTSSQPLMSSTGAPSSGLLNYAKSWLPWGKRSQPTTPTSTYDVPQNFPPPSSIFSSSALPTTPPPPTNYPVPVSKRRGLFQFKDDEAEETSETEEEAEMTSDELATELGL